MKAIEPAMVGVATGTCLVQGEALGAGCGIHKNSFFTLLYKLQILTGEVDYS